MGLLRTRTHPHLSYDGEVVLVHNGIIENYAALRARFSCRRHSFCQRDRHRSAGTLDCVASASATPCFRGRRCCGRLLPSVEGTFGIAMLVRSEPGLVILIPAL